MFDPVKWAFARCIMRPYRDHLAVTTPQMREFVNRRFDKACQFAQTRMIDQAESMLEKYLRTDKAKDWVEGDSPPTRPHLLPVIIVAFARDYAPTGRDYTRQIADMEYVILPGDKKERVFGLRTVAGDLRVQIAFFAREEPTAKSMAAQFLLFLDETTNRRFYTRYRFAGLTLPWPVQIESPETPAMNIAADAQNLNILTVD